MLFIVFVFSISINDLGIKAKLDVKCRLLFLINSAYFVYGSTSSSIEKSKRFLIKICENSSGRDDFTSLFPLYFSNKSEKFFCPFRRLICI
jgi:hypothetical protein